MLPKWQVTTTAGDGKSLLERIVAAEEHETVEEVVRGHAQATELTEGLGTVVDEGGNVFLWHFRNGEVKIRREGEAVFYQSPPWSNG